MKILNFTILFMLLYSSFTMGSNTKVVHEKSKIISNDIVANNRLPLFFFSSVPAILIKIDGTLVFKKINTHFSQVINSNSIILFNKNEQRFYLKAAYRWFESTKTDKKNIHNLSWKLVIKTPNDLAEYIETLPKETVNIEKLNSVPEIFISFKSAVLIQTNGKPVFTSIPRTELSFIQNSDNDIFRAEKNKQLYLLVSGRWFTAKQLDGAWEYMFSQKLPSDFRAIPFNSRKWHVLSCIADTSAAKDAIKKAQIEKTIKVKKGLFDFSKILNSSLQFLPLDNGEMQYAINTTTPVVKVQDEYYTCISAAWYKSNNLNEKWKVATEIPKVIYSISPKSFLYHITFVKISKINEHDVEFIYTAGYNYSFIENYSIVYGTGYQYPAIWQGHWYPRPQTYGYNIGYDPFEHQWNRCNRYSENNIYHIQCKVKNPTLPPIIGGNYVVNPAIYNDRILTQNITDDSEDEDQVTKQSLIKKDFETRQAGDWDSSVSEASMDPPNRENSVIISSVGSSRIKNREQQASNRGKNNVNSRQRGVSLFERYRTYNSKSLKQSYGGGRLRTGTINSRGQFRGTLQK